MCLYNLLLANTRVNGMHGGGISAPGSEILQLPHGRCSSEFILNLCGPSDQHTIILQPPVSVLLMASILLIPNCPI